MHTSLRIQKFLSLFLLVALAAALLVIRLDIYPKPWFDEGFTLHAASVLVDHQVYGTYTMRGARPFDPMVSSGPTIVLPIALMFRLFGAGILQARLVAVGFTLISVVCLFWLGTRLYGLRNGLLGLLLLLALPVAADARLLYLGRQALGEPAALALISAGFVLLLESRLRGWSPGAALAGVAFGLGLIAKLQMGFALLPALLLLTLVHARRHKGGGSGGLTQAALPLLLAAVVVLLWLLAQRAGTPQYLWNTYNQISTEGLWLHFFTGLFGRTLAGHTWLIVGLIALAAAGGGWRLWRAGLRHERDCVDLGLVVMGGVFAVWFALFSIGWTRYAFVTLALSAPLLGKLAGDALRWAAARVRLPEQVAYAGLVAVLGMAVVYFNLFPALEYPDSGLRAVVEFIRAEIPPGAVIESWEWQLDGLTGRHDAHHPSWRLVYDAIRQYSHERRPFDLKYDPFQADPDYLIIGPYGAWTRIYDQPAVWESFVDLARIGEYHILQRIRP